MRNLLLVALLAILGLQMRAADSFDELDLYGGWELVSCTGTYDIFTMPSLTGARNPAASECKYLYIGDMICYYDNHDLEVNLPGYTKPVTVQLRGGDSSAGLFYIENAIPWDDYDLYQDGTSISIVDVFISNGNKLHIIMNESELRFHFVIESLTASEMRLRSFDGKCSVVYKRIGNTDVNTIAADDLNSESTFYTLDGVPASAPSRGIYVEKKGAKAKKVLKQ